MVQNAKNVQNINPGLHPVQLVTPENPELDGTHLRIAIVQARFNEAITSSMAKSCLDELALLKVAPLHIHHCTVPGALEIPFALQALAQTDDFDALIALGCVIRGETYHFEVVANESSAGVNRVALDNILPIVNAILTVETLEQAEARAIDKGRDAAQVAVEMAHLNHSIEALIP